LPPQSQAARKVLPKPRSADPAAAVAMKVIGAKPRPTR
jgi:hypothetical protein